VAFVKLHVLVKSAHHSSINSVLEKLRFCKSFCLPYVRNGWYVWL